MKKHESEGVLFNTFEKGLIYKSQAYPFRNRSLVSYLLDFASNISPLKSPNRFHFERTLSKHGPSFLVRVKTLVDDEQWRGEEKDRRSTFADESSKGNERHIWEG